MVINLYKIRIVTLLVSTLFLYQCTNTGSSIAETPTPLVTNKKQQNPYPLTTKKYLAQAKNQEGIEQQKTLLSAAGRMISEGHWRESAPILTQTSNLTPALNDEKNILLADIELKKDRPQHALNKLMNISEDNLSAYYQIRFHQLLAKAYQASEKPLESIKERVKLDSLIHDESQQKRNQRALWLTLTHLSPTQLTEFLANTNNEDLQAWLQLALISRQNRANPQALMSALEQWQKHFHHHSARTILPNPLSSISSKMRAQPKQIALLLPLTGALQGPGTAVRDGFMAAYQNTAHAESLRIKTYDTTQGDIKDLYQNALTEGADYIVGPLTKPQVAVIANLPHPVPTLLLNDADNMVEENSYSFGLSPLKEAAAVAVKAHNKGYHRALIIAPATDWGADVSKAFIRQWQKNGGRIVDVFDYSSREDLNKKMKDFLHINLSQQREKKVKELLGSQIQTVMSRRQDFDMIFLLAYPTIARQIMPLLRYYDAADVPVFATASVYGGTTNALKDKDLDGIIFCDIPWVFSHQMGARNWPEQFNSYNRLYALGKESYSIATQLNQLMLFPADQSNNEEGVLYLNSSQQVARVLEWGQFRQGLVHSLGEAV